MSLLCALRFTPSLLACFIASLMQNTYADSEADPITQFDTIVVEVARIDKALMNAPTSVAYITQQQDQNINVNLSETLKGTAGLQINNRENYAQDLQISMRGFGARSSFGVRGVRLYVDGIPATMPDGQGQTSNIDLNSLHHLEVLGGAFSSLYGNSSGGAILASTQTGKDAPSVKIGYSAGSHNKQQGSIVLQGGSTASNLPSYVISTSYFDTNGFREHSGAHKALTNTKLNWDLEDGSSIAWVNNYVNIKADDAGGLTRSDWQSNPKQVATNVLKYNARKEIEQFQTGLTLDKPLNDQQNLYIMGYWGQRAVTQYQSIPNTAQGGVNHAGGVIDFDRQFYGTDLRWTGRDLIPNTKLIAGVALDAMDENRQGFENFAGDVLGVKGNLRRKEDNTLWNIDPYLQMSYAFAPDWTLDAGLRYSNVHFESKDRYLSNGDNSGKTDYQKLLPSIALSWQVLPELMLYSNYAQGFETPTFTEMSYPADTAVSNTLNLKAASSDSYEIGVKSQNELGDFTLAAFYIQTENDIVSAASDGGRSTYRNADQTLRKGIELSWQKNLWQDLTAQASYSYIDATFDADIPAISSTVAAIAKGNYIPGISKNQAYISLGWLPETGFNAGMDLRYSDRIFVDDVNSDQAPSYTVTSLNVGYKWQLDDWKINSFARLDNLFDKDYAGSVIVNESNKRFFEPADGRNWSAGLSVIKAF